jgi:hypothetical protein
MGPRAQADLADGQAAMLDVLGHILQEQRAQRVTLQRICANLQIEIEDRAAGDNKLGETLVGHEREINRLKLVTPLAGE